MKESLRNVAIAVSSSLRVLKPQCGLLAKPIGMVSSKERCASNANFTSSRQAQPYVLFEDDSVRNERRLPHHWPLNLSFLCIEAKINSLQGRLLSLEVIHSPGYTMEIGKPPRNTQTRWWVKRSMVALRMQG